MKLYYFETTNGHKVCGTAKYLQADVDFVRVDLTLGEHKHPEYLAINPNGKIPTLVDDEHVVWESSAIMAYLARGTDLWPDDPIQQIEIMQWIAWDTAHFGRHAGTHYFENYIKGKFGLGEPSAAALDEARGFFCQFAEVLEQRLSTQPYVLGDQLTIADFHLNANLTVHETSKLDFSNFQAISRWHNQLNSLPAWAEPFPTQG